MAKLILGIAGEMGCGKGTIAKYAIGKYGSGSLRFSTILRDVLDRLYLEQSRENLQKLSTVLRQNFGEDLFSGAMMHDAENSGQDLVIIDGVRRMTDIVHLRELPHFKLIYVDADIRARYERIVGRGENVNETQKTFEQFQEDHKDESELQILGLKDYADYVVDNNSTFEQLYVQVDEIVKENLK